MLCCIRAPVGISKFTEQIKCRNFLNSFLYNGLYMIRYANVDRIINMFQLDVIP